MKAKVNGKEEYVLEYNQDNISGKINGRSFTLDIIDIKPALFHVLHNNKSYTVEVVAADAATKSFTLNINGNKHTLEVKDKYDELLQKLGMDTAGSKKVADIKAPMPGLVLDIRVSKSDIVAKGDALLVLEAMKMENIIKSPVDGKIKDILVKKGNAVEKNQLLISFEKE